MDWNPNNPDSDKPPLEAYWRSELGGEEIGNWLWDGSGANMTKANQVLNKYLNKIDPAHRLPRYEVVNPFQKEHIKKVDIGPIMYATQLDIDYYRPDEGQQAPTENPWHAEVLLRKGNSKYSGRPYVVADSARTTLWYATNDMLTKMMDKTRL